MKLQQSTRIGPRLRKILAYEDESELVPAKQSRSLIGIVKQFLQRSAQDAVQQQLAGVYASLVGPPNPPDPRNIPGAATAQDTMD